jgi:hypothetical protein
LITPTLAKKTLHHTEKDKVFLSVRDFLRRDPLLANDYASLFLVILKQEEIR